MTEPGIRGEGMRIGGDIVYNDRSIPVRYPYTNEVVEYVPTGKAEHTRKAFEVAAHYPPKLTRY